MQPVRDLFTVLKATVVSGFLVVVEDLARALRWLAKIITGLYLRLKPAINMAGKAVLGGATMAATAAGGGPTNPIGLTFGYLVGRFLGGITDALHDSHTMLERIHAALDDSATLNMVATTNQFMMDTASQLSGWSMPIPRSTTQPLPPPGSSPSP